jgi:hypothetical protein
MPQPPSLLWNQDIQTTASPVIPLDSQSQQARAMVQVNGSGMTSPQAWSSLQSNLCLTRNDPCVPATPTPPGSYS